MRAGEPDGRPGRDRRAQDALRPILRGPGQTVVLQPVQGVSAPSSGASVY